MGYKLWLNDYADIVKYYKNKDYIYYLDCIKYEPLSFMIGNKLKHEFTIKEIDSLTCSCYNEESLIALLKERKNKYINENSGSRLTLTYEYKNQLKKVKLIFNDKLLRYYAITSRNKSTLENTDGLSEFINYIKTIALNPVTAPYLLNPDKIDDLTYQEKWDLKNALPVGIYKSENKLGVTIGSQSNLVNLLNQFNYFTGEYNKTMSSSLNEELDYINKNINKYFRDYQHLRKIITWENTYKKILEDKIKTTTDEIKKTVYSSQLKQVIIEQDYRNGIRDNRDQISIISYEDANERIKNLESDNKNLVKK